MGKVEVGFNKRTDVTGGEVVIFAGDWKEG